MVIDSYWEGNRCLYGSDRDASVDWRDDEELKVQIYLEGQEAGVMLSFLRFLLRAK